MVQSGISRFDLYDFFSVFLPGTMLLLGLSPFLPTGTGFTPGLAGLLVILGYVVGRIVHGIAIALENIRNEKGHRKMFVSQISDPGFVSESMKEQFVEACCTEYSELDLCDSQSGSIDEDELEPLYTLVRSYIHIDSRGRSRTFQATYSFYRSMSTVVIVLFVVFSLYAALRLLEVTQDVAVYTSYIGSVELDPLVVSSVPTFAAIVLFEIFYRSKTKHQRYYIQYLVSDFLTLYETQENGNTDPSSQSAS